MNENLKTNLEYALTYATELDLHVFPIYRIAENGFCSCGKTDCRSPGKHPMTAQGLKDASKDETRINDWWTATPDANIGIVTGKVSDIAVLDVDVRHGGDVSLEKLIEEFALDFSKTLSAKTGSGGFHYYFEYPQNLDWELRNSASKLGPGLDIRAVGGYVVAPPSNHVSGGLYEWIYTDGVMEFPQEFLDKLAPQPVFQTSSQSSQPSPKSKSPYITLDASVIAAPDSFQVPNEIKDGTRNDVLTQIAGALRSKGLSQTAIEAALLVENNRLCLPPLDEAEVRLIAKSVSRYAPKNQFTFVSDDDSAKQDTQTTQTAVNPDGSNGSEADNNADDADNNSETAATQNGNTTHFYYAGEFRRQVFPPREVLAFHIARQEWGVTSAIKNIGKSTFLRNAMICLAAGRALAPFVPGGKPVKVLMCDFETTREMLQPDINKMYELLTDEEIKAADENLIIAHKGLLNGELFTFQKHLSLIVQICKQENVQFVVVDNLSSAFQVTDEQSNSVMNQKVVQPILKFTAQTNTGLMLVHHSGKSNDNENYGGRGGSVLEDLATVGFTLRGNVHHDKPLEIINTKRKDGPGYSESFSLNRETRWFEQSSFIPPPRPKSVETQVRDFVCYHEFPHTVRTREINEKFENLVLRDRITVILRNLVASDEINSPSKGRYCAPLADQNSAQNSGQNAPQSTQNQPQNAP